MLAFSQDSPVGHVISRSSQEKHQITRCHTELEGSVTDRLDGGMVDGGARV